MNNYNIMVRGIVTNLDSDVPNAVERVRKVRIYPLNEGAIRSRISSPPFRARSSTRFRQRASSSGHGYPPYQQQPDPGARSVLHGHAQTPRDREGQAVPARRAPARHPRGGQPDRRCDGAHDALRCGASVQRHQRDSRNELELGAACESNPVTATHGQLDERLHYTYGAIYTSPGIGVMKAGPGSNYIQTLRTRTATASTVASPTACACRRMCRRRPSGP